MRLIKSSILTIVALIAALSAFADTKWPKNYQFYGRWDLRTAGRAVTVSSGSYVLARFSGGTLLADFDLSLNQPSPLIGSTGKGSMPTIAWRIDEGDWREAEIASTVKLSEGLPKGSHRVMLMVRGLDEHQNRWTSPLTASLTFTGFHFDGQGKLYSPLKEWVKPKLTMEFFGDSITEGVLVSEGRAGVEAGMPNTWTWLSDARLSYAAQTAMALGAQWRQVGFGAAGIQHGGSGGAPGALNSFAEFYAGCPRDNWQPDVVVVNHGTNDSGMPSAQYLEYYSSYMKLIRSAYPKAKIVALRPFVGAQEAAIKAVVAERKAAGDAAIYFIDSTGWYSGPLHPNFKGSAELAEKLVKALKAEVLK